MSSLYEEVVIFEGIAERTGNIIERASGPSRTFCASMSQLGSSSRRLGDGLYYLAHPAWPDDTETVDLNRPWVTIG